jgi:hypothetical protein
MIGWMNNVYYLAARRILTIRIPVWFLDTKLLRVHQEKHDIVLTYKILSDRKNLE